MYHILILLSTIFYTCNQNFNFYFLMFATSCFYIIKIRTKTHSEKSKIPRFYRLFKRFFLSPLVGRQPPAGYKARGARRGGRQSQGGSGRGAYQENRKEPHTSRIKNNQRAATATQTRLFARYMCGE